MSVLKQDQNAYDAYNVMDTVIMGNPQLYDIGHEKNALYEKEDFTDEDGLRAADLEAEYAELGAGRRRATPPASSRAWVSARSHHYNDMATLDARLKVKVLLAQALFGNPTSCMLDEPTNNLDIEAINWLNDFLLDFEGTVIVVSHDRHFLNTVCTHIVDIDYSKIKMYVGTTTSGTNPPSWCRTSSSKQNKRNEERSGSKSLSPASPPTNPSPSRPPPGASCWTSSPWRNCPLLPGRYPWVGFYPRPGGGQGHFIRHRRVQDGGRGKAVG